MLHTAGIQHHGVVVIRQLRCRQPRPGEEAGFATGGREGQRRALALGIVQQHLAAAVIQVAQRAAVAVTARRARPLARLPTQFGITDAAQIVPGGRVMEATDFLVHRFGIGVIEGVGITHGASHAGNDLPVRQALPWRLDGARHQGKVALAVDHHALAFGPQRGR